MASLAVMKAPLKLGPMGSDMDPMGGGEPSAPDMGNPYLAFAKAIRESIQQADDEALADALKSMIDMYEADQGEEPAPVAPEKPKLSISVGKATK